MAGVCPGPMEKSRTPRRSGANNNTSVDPLAPFLKCGPGLPGWGLEGPGRRWDPRTPQKSQASRCCHSAASLGAEAFVFVALKLCPCSDRYIRS